MQASIIGRRIARIDAPAAPETCDIPAITLTAAAMPQDVARGKRAGFFRYLTKPMDVKVFLAVVDEALATKPSRQGNSMEA